MRISWTKREKDIIHRISLETMIPERDVETMVASQFLMLKEALESGSVADGTLLNAMLPRFGKFYVNVPMVKRYLEKNGITTKDVRSDD